MGAQLTILFCQALIECIHVMSDCYSKREDNFTKEIGDFCREGENWNDMIEKVNDEVGECDQKHVFGWKIQQSS